MEIKTFYSETRLGWSAAKDRISVQLNSLPIDGEFAIFPRGKER